MVVQNDPDEDLGLLAEPFSHLDITVVRAFEEALPDLDADGLVVLGGAPSVYDLSTGPWMADVMRLIRRAHEAGKPVLGICLGAQLAAHALGGRAKPGLAPEVGFAPIDVLDARDPIVGGLSGLPLFSLHHDTYEMPPGATRLAASEAYPEQAFRLGRTWGLQFHVDLAPATLRAILPDDPDLPALGIDAAALLREVDAREKGMREAAKRVAAGFAGL